MTGGDKFHAPTGAEMDRAGRAAARALRRMPYNRSVRADAQNTRAWATAGRGGCAVTAPRILHMEDARMALPLAWRGNGCSSPFRALHGRLYSQEALSAIDLAADGHDGGYGPLRLTGSGFEHWTRADWNRAYRECLTIQGYPVIGQLHYLGLVLGSLGPWLANAEEMERIGWHTWLDFIEATAGDMLAYRVAAQQRLADSVMPYIQIA